MRYCPRSWDMGKQIVIGGCWKLAAPIPKKVMLGVGVCVCVSKLKNPQDGGLPLGFQTNRRARRPIPPRGAAGSGDAAGRGGAEVVKVWPVDASANKANEGDAQKKLLLKTQFRHVTLQFDNEFLRGNGWRGSAHALASVGPPFFRVRQTKLSGQELWAHRSADRPLSGVSRNRVGNVLDGVGPSLLMTSAVLC